MTPVPHAHLLFICTEKGLFFNKERLYFLVAGEDETSDMLSGASEVGISRM